MSEVPFNPKTAVRRLGDVPRQGPEHPFPKIRLVPEEPAERSQQPQQSNPTQPGSVSASQVRFDEPARRQPDPLRSVNTAERSQPAEQRNTRKEEPKRETSERSQGSAPTSSQAQPEQPARLTPGQVVSNRLTNREIDRRMRERWGISWRPPGPVPTSPQDRSADALRERGPVRENRSDSHRGPEYRRPDDTTRPHGSAVVYPHGVSAPRGALQERDPNSVRGPGIGRGIRHTPHR